MGCGKVQSANNLLRQTVITVILQFLYTFTFLQLFSLVDVSLKTHVGIMYAENSTTVYRNHNNANPVMHLHNVMQVIQRRIPHFAGCSLN